MLMTYKFRIKDSSHKKWLSQKANMVNFVWNYCNEISSKVWNQSRKWVSAFDLGQLCKSAGKEIGLKQHSIQSVCAQFEASRNQFKKPKLNWRTQKRNLGWIPFSNQSLSRLENTSFKFMKRKFKFWKDRNLQGRLKTGSFNENAKGNWFVNLVCERTGPSGLSSLGVRSWKCSSCGVIHDRDVNAAQNILKIGLGDPDSGDSACLSRCHITSFCLFST